MAKLITYDLRAPGRNYDNLISAIKSYPNWGKITEAAWVINSTDSCEKIRDNLNAHIDANDRIFVAALTGEAAWKNVICEAEWLKKALSS